MARKYAFSHSIFIMLSLTQILEERKQVDPLFVIELNISGKQLESISILQYFKNIEQLNISANKLSSIAPLKSLLNLRVLLADDNCISTLEPLSQLANLEILHINGNPIQGRQELEWLCPLSRLRKLSAMRVPSFESDDTIYSFIITIFPQLEYLNEERIRNYSGELLDLDRFIEALPVIPSKQKITAEPWVSEDAFEIHDLPGFAKMCRELEEAIYEVTSK